jgi:hypothetical protein
MQNKNDRRYGTLLFGDALYINWLTLNFVLYVLCYHIVRHCALQRIRDGLSRRSVTSEVLSVVLSLPRNNEGILLETSNVCIV